MPARRDISIYKGDDYTHRLTVLRDGEPVDLTGREFAAQVRDGEDGADLTGTPPGAGCHGQSVRE